MELQKFTSRLDGLGITASTLCALHCFLVPLLAVVLPFSGLAFLADPLIDRLMMGTTLFIGILSLGISWFRHHRKLLPLLVFAGGFCLIAVVHVSPGHDHSLPAGTVASHIRVAEGHHEHSGTAKIILLVAGGLSMGASHLLNWRFSRAHHLSRHKDPVKFPAN